MVDVKKGDDAGDHAPKPTGGKAVGGASDRKQDAPNFDHRDDSGEAIPVEDMNSANDE